MVINMKKSKVLCAIIIIVALTISVAACANNSNGAADEPVLLTVGERAISEVEAFHFLFSSAHIMRTYLPYIGWNDVIEGIPVVDFIKNEAVSAMRLYYAIHVKADELSAGLTAFQESELDRLWYELIIYYGNEEALFAKLEQDGLNLETYRYFNETTLLLENLRELHSDTHSGAEFTSLMDEWREEIPYTLSEKFNNIDAIDIRELYERFNP